jgi:putative chitinase
MSGELITELQTDLQSVITRLEALRPTPAAAAPTPAPVPAAPAPSPHPGLDAEGAFYDWLRDNDMLGPKISASEFRGCDAITRSCAAAQWPVDFAAYALGTAYLETNHQMLPVREAYWLSDSAANTYFRRMYDPLGARPDVAKRLGNTQPGDGILFPGRGYPQLTGRANYVKAGEALGVDLVGHPERALEPEIAAEIMIRGMAEGWFTGRKLSDYLPASGTATLEQFVPARHIINGSDRAADVGGFAVGFQRALEAGKWKF